MLPLPTARTQVRDAAGRRALAAALARHAGRRARRHAVALGQIALWLGMVVLSLTTIGGLVARGAASRHDSDEFRRSVEARASAQLAAQLDAAEVRARQDELEYAKQELRRLQAEVERVRACSLTAGPSTPRPDR